MPSPLGAGHANVLGLPWRGAVGDREGRQGTAEEPSGDGDVGHAECTGQGSGNIVGGSGEGVRQEPAHADKPIFWSESRPVMCRDGKLRPVPLEPSLFPLADGIPNRVGILRGAGNAIVAQQAAVFIQEFLRAAEEQQLDRASMKLLEVAKGEPAGKSETPLASGVRQ